MNKKISTRIAENGVFSSKANTLKILKGKLSKSMIEKIFDFTVKDWKNNKNNLLEEIRNAFNSKVIIRSSAKGEDSFEASFAGTYASILDVNPHSKRNLQNAIDKIINSYRLQGNTNESNQILIQTQTTNIITSGVVFTITPDNGSPYYVINYDDGKSTIGVTQGSINNTIKFVRSINLEKLPERWRKLITAIKEIESFLHTYTLDIEFGITQRNEIIIFQVRPITSVKTNVLLLEKKIAKVVSNNKEKFAQLNSRKHVIGSKTIFSDMSDWNPAEIIGTNPNLLDYSLYDYLIMNDVWYLGRTKIDYQNVDPYSLMVKFGNKPYVDIRGSFNSLIPQIIPYKLKKKLMNFYLQKLNNFPHLHDKVEFEILFTCYDTTIDKRLTELKKFKFTNDEINIIKSSLLDFTNNIIANFNDISNKCANNIRILSKNRFKIKKQISSARTYNELVKSAESLLEDCKRFGTLPFSTMARIAFIASMIFKSLQKNGVVDLQFADNFMNSISTPLSHIQEDIIKYNEKKISKREFLKKYGHLRPGTYDITADRYDNQNDFFDTIKFSKLNHKPDLKFDEIKLIKELKKHGMIFNDISFLDFIKKSLIQREQLKFEFTKNLSDALELIAEAANKLGFTRDEIANLEISTILNSKNYNLKLVKKIFRSKIDKEFIRKSLNNYLVLPSIIFSEKDFEIITYFISQPNFITTKKIKGDIFTLNSHNKINHSLSNKIILIENADPGYDWIFTKNPAGLITKYGGVASHMAIRCAEIGLPAAIGCGDILYEKLLLSSEVMLNCKNNEILILEHSKIDEEIEARKVLKSLGYIK